MKADAIEVADLTKKQKTKEFQNIKGSDGLFKGLQDHNALARSIDDGKSPLFVHQVLKYTRAWKDYNDPNFNPVNEVTTLSEIKMKQQLSANLHQMVTKGELNHKMAQLGYAIPTAELDERIKEAGGLHVLEEKVWENFVDSLPNQKNNSQRKYARTVKQQMEQYLKDEAVPREEKTAAQFLIPAYLNAQKRLRKKDKTPDQTTESNLFLNEQIAKRAASFPEWEADENQKCRGLAPSGSFETHNHDMHHGSHSLKGHNTYAAHDYWRSDVHKWKSGAWLTGIAPLTHQRYLL